MLFPGICSLSERESRAIWAHEIDFFFTAVNSFEHCPEGTQVRNSKMEITCQVNWYLVGAALFLHKAVSSDGNSSI